MTAVTITKVADDVRNFATGNGSFAAFKVMLEDGRIGEVTAKADNVTKRQEQFRSFIGNPTDLIVEDAGSFPDGNPKPLRVKLPQQQQGPGKSRDYVPRYVDSEEGWRESDERIDRRRALELAQAEGSGITTELAQKFYEWLRASAGGESTGVTGSAPAPSASRPESDSYGEGETGSGPISGAGGEVLSVANVTPPVPEPDHEPEWGPALMPRLSAKGWKVCVHPGCDAPQHSPRIIKEVSASVLTAPVEERSDLA